MLLQTTICHQVHHRAQLMVLQRMLGIVPHLTREQQARMARIEDTATRVANRLAEMSNQRETTEEEIRKLRGLLRLTLTVVLVLGVVVLGAVGFLIFRGH